MVSTIAAALFLTAITLALWTIVRTLRAHSAQIANLIGPQSTQTPQLATKLRASDFRKPVSVTPLRRVSLRAAA